MPAWAQSNGGPMSDADVANVTAYVLSLEPVSTSPQPPSQPTEGPIRAGTVLLVFGIVVVLLVVVGIVYYRRAQEPG